MPQLSDGQPSKNGIYVIPLPPPTVNGELHLGHALTVSVEDALCRW
jgi:valyl-tRNA synthetase